jgi:hypothetical protein
MLGGPIFTLDAVGDAARTPSARPLMANAIDAALLAARRAV